MSRGWRAGALAAGGPGGAVAGHRADDEPRVAGPERGGCEAESLDGTRSEVVKEDVGAVEQPRQHLTSGVGLQVERDRLLAAVEPDEVAREPADSVVVAACEVAAVDAFE